MGGGGGMLSPSTLGGIMDPRSAPRTVQGFAPSLGGDPIQQGTLPDLQGILGGGKVARPPGTVPDVGVTRTAPGGPQPLGAPAQAPQAGGVMGAPGGISPAVMAMIESALGGSRPGPGPAPVPPLARQMPPQQRVTPPPLAPRPAPVSPMQQGVQRTIQRLGTPGQVAEMQKGFATGASPQTLQRWAGLASQMSAAPQAERGNQ